MYQVFSDLTFLKYSNSYSILFQKIIKKLDNTKYISYHFNNKRGDNMPTGYGEGSIYQSGDRWVAAIKSPTGKRKYFYGKTKSEVRKKLNQYKSSPLLSGNDYSEVGMEQFFAEWLENDIKENLKPKSYDTKEYVVKKLIIPYFKYLKVGQIKPTHIQKFINKLVEDEYSYSTIKKAYDALNQRFKLAVERENIPKSPVVGIILPKTHERQESNIRFFSNDELKSLIEASQAKYPNGTPIYRLGYIVQLLAYTGLRVGEALALTWDDIDFENNTINVTKNMVTVVNRDKTATNNKSLKKLVQDTPKTASSNRVIPISNNAKTALESIWAKNSHNNLVLSSANGTPLDLRNISRMFDNIQDRAGIVEKGTIHSLRHTFATRLIEVGTNVKVVSKLLGHADVNITYNTYVHVIERQKVKAIQNIDLI